MLEFIGLTQSAAQEIISSRKLQSLDYEESKLILDLAKGQMPQAPTENTSLIMKEVGKGVIISTENDHYENERNSLTLDFKTLSFDEVNDNLKIACLQKLLRFCMKYWENLGHSPSEIIPLESTKGIIFPFSSSHRIVTELAPFKNKSNKINKYKGKHILAYKFGRSLGAGNKEECETTNLRKSLDAIFSVETFNENRIKKTKNPDNELYNAINLGENDLINTTNLLGRPNPIDLLSDKQKSFVYSDWNHPARINGPAGSGKTICLVLKAVRAFEETDGSIRLLFLVPSTSVRNTVEYFLKVSASTSGISGKTILDSVQVRTTQQVCLELLTKDISSSELIDEDNYEAKQSQLLYVMEIVEQKKAYIANQKSFLSERLFSFFTEEDSLAIAESLIHEFGVVIKGRCSSIRETYIKTESLKYGLPIEQDNDKYFIFSLFEEYQQKLDMLGQFDPDDISLSAMGKLDSPIWKRRRLHEGYDLILIDELHLLNFNELCLIHFLTKDAKKAPISFAVDATQAIGDVSWKDNSVLEYLNISDFEDSEEITNLTAVFRCSESITKLASSITSSGATLFTNFKDPLAYSTDMQSELNNYIPQYYLLDIQEDHIHSSALDIAEAARSLIDCHRHRVVIIYFDRILFGEARNEFQQSNKPVSYLEERGDISLIERARSKNDYILALADYVGGLEFDAVVLVGVDRGRMPREDKTNNAASVLFQNYIAHNKMYVAVTRATKHICIIGEKRRGESPILRKASQEKLIQIVEQ